MCIRDREQVAERAGVSRSTLYRRFASKEDIVLTVPNSWLTAWDDAVSSLDPNAGLGEALTIGCMAVARAIDDTRESVLAAYAAMAESQSLQSSSPASADWLDRSVALAKAHAPHLSDFDAMAIAGAYLGAIDTMMLGWVASGGKGKVSDTTTRLLERLAPIVED